LKKKRNKRKLTRFFFLSEKKETLFFFIPFHFCMIEAERKKLFHSCFLFRGSRIKKVIFCENQFKSAY